MKILNLTIVLALLSLSAFATQDKKQVKVRIQAQGGNLDEATVYFDQGINPTYNFQEDAQKVYSGVAGQPAIFTVTSDNIECSINGYGTLGTSEITPLGVDVDADGMYVITTPLLDNFDATTIIRLEDRDRGTFIDLRTNFYQVMIHANDPTTGRFFIHVSTPASVIALPAGCSNNDGKLSVNTDNSITWTSCSLLDAFNNQVGTFNNINGQYDFTGLAEGDYFMVYQYGSYTTTQSFHVTGNFVTASVAASKQDVVTGEEINFSAIANNTNQFAWDFGDGTLIMGVANPILSYYTPGVYTVNLICSNSQGCTDNAQVTINVSLASGVENVSKDAANVFSNGKTITVSVTEINKNATMQVYNLLGESVYTRELDSEKSTVTFDEQPTGYYVVSVKNGNEVSTKRVYLGQ